MSIIEIERCFINNFKKKWRGENAQIGGVYFKEKKGG